MEIQVDITNNAPEARKLLDDLLEKALEMCGLQAERHAKLACPVDTGRLRNSITHAIGGKPAAIRMYKATYGSATYVDKNGKRRRRSASSKKAGNVGVGFYSGTAPEDAQDEWSVWLGTNVIYAESVELGSSKKAPNGYLRIAIENHVGQYKRIIERVLAEMEDAFGGT